MKKLLAFFAVLALVVPLAFTVDFSIGGRALGVAEAVLGNTEKGVGDNGNEPWTRWTDDIRVLFSLTNDNKSAGAAFRLTGKVWGTVNANWFQAWWQPASLFYFSLGKIQENRRYNPEPAKLGWGLAGRNDAFDMKCTQFAPWDTYQGIGPHNDNIYAELKAASDRVGMQFSVIPMENLHFTFVWNGFDDIQTYNPSRTSVKNVLIDGLGVNASYTTDAGGEASVFFQNGAIIGEGSSKRTRRQIGLMYTQQVLNPLYAEGAVLLPLPDNNNSKITFIGAGIGLGYLHSEIEINARVAAEIGLVKAKYNAAGNLVSGHGTKIGFDLSPSWTLNWSLKIYFPVGFAVDIDANTFGWSFCPYIVKDAGWVSFWTGFRLWSDNSSALRKSDGNPSVSYAIPIGLMLSF